MKATEKIRAQYEKLRSEATKVHVEEWDLDIYVYPLTVKEASKLAAVEQDSGFDAVLDILIVRAKDENGEPLFTPEDKEELSEITQPDVLANVVEMITKDLNESYAKEDGVDIKNS